MSRMVDSDKSGFERVMDGWRLVINVSERTLLDNVAATVPWLAPVAPAYMVWHNAVTLLGWPVWVAWVVAAAVEGLGLSVVSTAFALWQGKAKSFKVAVITTIFYLAVVIVVNVLLDLGAPAWIAKALLSLLSVPAAVTIALRSQYSKSLADDQAAWTEAQALEREERERAQALEREERESARKEREEEQERIHRLQVEEEERVHRWKVEDDERKFAQRMEARKVSESFQKPVESGGKVSETETAVAETFSDWRQVPVTERKKIGKMTVKQIMKAYGKKEKTAGNWRRDAIAEFGGQDE